MDADIANVTRLMRELYEISFRRNWPIAAIQLAATDEGPMSPFLLFTSPACKATYGAHSPESVREMVKAMTIVQGHQERATRGLETDAVENLIAGLSDTGNEGEGEG